MDTSVIRRLRGVRIETGAARPFLMDDPERVFFVEAGHLNVFAVELAAREPVGRRRFVARVPAGQMAFGAARVPDPEAGARVFGFLAVPALDTVVISGERAGVASDRFDLAATAWIDDWITRLAAFSVRGRPVPRAAVALEADPEVRYPAGAVLCAQHHDVVWVSANTRLGLVARDDFAVEEGDPLLPVTEHAWFETGADAEVSAIHTPTALLRKQLWPAFDRFSTLILRMAIADEAAAAAALRSRRQDVWRARRASVSAALRGLGDVLGVSSGRGLTEAAGRTPLQTAAALVAESCGAPLGTPPGVPADPPGGPADAVETVEAMTRRSGIRTRRLTLSPGWWKRDGPPFLGFTAPDRRPLAVLPSERGRYLATDPEAGTTFTVDAAAAARVAPEGLAFYAPLPDEVPGAGTLLRFSLHRRRGDLRTVGAVGAMAGLAALAAPILTGKVLAEFIPRADASAWAAALAALLLVAFGNAVFGVVQGLAMLRLEGRVDERLQAAVWSRLIALPAPFFRKFTAGDLADRANSIGAVRATMTGAALQGAVSGVFSFFSFLLLLSYSWQLALYVAAMLLALAAATVFYSYNQIRQYREVFRAQGAINGFVFQFINGLSKLRIANAETYALARWARQFSKQKRASLAAGRWAAGQHAVSGMFRPLALVAIFGFVYYAGSLDGRQPALDLATFLSFYAAFGQLTAAVGGLTIAVTTAVGVVPLLERVRPVLDARPETADGGADPGDLKGDIEFANVTFRYGPRDPNAIEGVSFRIRQGEYVAFVGPSGSGKSTIYRLLLGFEQPSSGSVFLDGHDLSGLDPVAVRRRMGVVLQGAQLVAGSIYENIAGMAPLGSEDAWAAARAAALEDDIRAMPMNMRTVVSSGGSGLSTGQKQRLLIARAFARRPRVLLFDEATSALDNRSQAVVQGALRKLGVTRIVIAHRLSSIRDVDRIHVLDAGRIVESGRYDDLMKRDGVFAALSRRQLVQA